MKSASNPSTTGFIACKRRTVTIDTLAAQRLLEARGCHYPLKIQLNRFSVHNEYILQNGCEITILLAPFVVIKRLFVAIPILWPAALTPLNIWRRDLAITIAHEMRHALQGSGVVPEKASWKKPLVSYIQLKQMSYLYAFFGVALLLLRYFFEQAASPLIWFWVINALLLAGMIIVTLTVVCCNVSADEVDARKAERTDWKNWEHIIQITPG